MEQSVLIVEDEWVIAEDEAETLRGAGYDVVGPFGSVDAALAALERNRVDAAFLDVELQNERSFAIAERLRQLGIPYFFVSGHDDRTFPQLLRDGMALIKPVEPASLLAAAATMTRMH